MTTDGSEVERLVHAFAETVNEQDYDRLPEILAEDFTWRTPAAPGGAVHGPEESRAVMEQITGAFPDFHAEPGDVFVDGNEGMATVRFTGTHKGEFMEVPPTGKEVELVGTSKVRVADGKLQEQHDVANFQTLLAQLGVTEG
jgi:steroid delta-isomerase-like uncharacterized protein